MNFDKDLQSVQEARDLAARAKAAQLEFKHFNQEQVDRVIKAMADAGYREAERLAKFACQESGFGNIADKKIKNEFASKHVYDSIKELKTVGIISIENGGKIIKIAEPMGVVAALIPSTNPTSTAIFKSLIALKCRNAIVCSPHPRTSKCTLEALRVMAEAAEMAGAPVGLIQGMTISTMEGTSALIHDNNIAVILATGSNQMVKAAYSSGKPAFGVGSGNVPAFIERSASIKKAVADIITGTTFDNGTICASEQAMVVDRPVKEEVIKEAKAGGCYFVNDKEKKMLERVIGSEGRMNADIVGKCAVWIASHAGFSVPSDTRVIVAECNQVGRVEPLSMEKLSPILAFYSVDGWLEGCHKCIELLEFGGVGHTLAIHSNDNDIIMKFAMEKPAFRIVVNTPSSLGGVGYTTALQPSLTLGVGTWAGSSVSENVSARHLMNVKTLAFESNPINKGNSVSSYQSSQGTSGFIAAIEERLIARAGNPACKPQFSNIKPEEAKKGKVFGSGMSKKDVDKIVNEFKK
jgi:acetaldehyde dehydrogenase (acetylating)